MVVPTYLKERQKRTISKYHRIHNEVYSKCALIKNHLISRFHQWKEDGIENIDKSTLDFVAKYDLLSLKREEEENKQIEELMKPLENKSLICYKNNFRENIDWRRGRIAGIIVSIVVRDGVIIEKTILTKKGNLVEVRRNELGLCLRFNSLLNNYFINLNKYFSE